jgi:cytidylate kinase
VQCIAQRDGMSLDEARHKVARVDEERRVFYARYFQSDFTSPHNFDMLLNTGAMSLDECAAAIVHMFRMRFGEPR